MEKPQLPDFLQNITVVLARTSHPANIGSAARAMRTMGLTRLVLVAPEKRPDLTTASMAAGAEALAFNAPVRSGRFNGRHFLPQFGKIGG